MKYILVLVLLINLEGSTELSAQRTQKATMMYKGLQNRESSWQLWFTDKKGKPYYFSAKSSITTPYVLYSTMPNGSLKENEKIIGSWFVIQYASLQMGKKLEHIITQVDAVVKKQHLEK